jgi:hypothetical protein
VEGDLERSDLWIAHGRSAAGGPGEGQEESSEESPGSHDTHLECLSGAFPFP